LREPSRLPSLVSPVQTNYYPSPSPTSPDKASATHGEYFQGNSARYWAGESITTPPQNFNRGTLPTPPTTDSETFKPIQGNPQPESFTVAAAVAQPQMGQSEQMGSSFAARRSATSMLPAFSLPGPPVSRQYMASQPNPASSLLTPPQGMSSDGMSQASSSSAQTAVPYYWSAPQPSFAYSSGAQQQPLYAPRGGMYAVGPPSRGSDGLPPPYENGAQYQSSMPMSSAGLSPLPSLAMSQQLMGSYPASSGPPVLSPNPSHEQFSPYSRQPATPSHYGGSQPSSTPHQANFPQQYSTTSPVQHHGMAPQRQSPISNGGQAPPLLQAAPQPGNYAPTYRPYGYNLPSMPHMGGALTNAHHPGGSMTMVGGPDSSIMGSQMLPNGAPRHVSMWASQPHHQQMAPAQNDRPFKCDQCPQSFNRNHDLKRHKRIHLAVKPFPCGHCDKSFSRKDALKVRLNIRIIRTGASTND
jgi:Zinc finger, C2H2 type